MKIEKAVCPHCGGPIEIGSRKILKCEYCGMPIVISDLEIDKTVDTSFEGTIPKVEKRSYEESPSFRIEKPRKHCYWTPVGFRTKKIWKMCIASVCYLFMLMFLVVPEDRFAIITMILAFFFSVHVGFSWQPFVDHLPGLKSKNIMFRAGIKTGYIFAAFMIFIMVMSSTVS